MEACRRDRVTGSVIRGSVAVQHGEIYRYLTVHDCVTAGVAGRPACPSRDRSVSVLPLVVITRTAKRSTATIYRRRIAHTSVQFNTVNKTCTQTARCDDKRPYFGFRRIVPIFGKLTSQDAGPTHVRCMSGFASIRKQVDINTIEVTAYLIHISSVVCVCVCLSVCLALEPRNLARLNFAQRHK